MKIFGKRIPLYKLYPFCGMILGLTFMLILPIRTVPDETFHLNQAYEVSNVLMGTPSGNNPIQMREDEVNNYNILSHYTREQYIAYWASLNDPLKSDVMTGSSSFKTGVSYPYFAGGLGITLGRVLKLGAGATLSLGRLFDLIVFVVCGTLTLWLMPFAQELMFVLLLMPMTLQQSMSYSYDMFVFAVSFLSISLFLRINYDEKQREKNKYIDLGILTVLDILLIPIKSHAYIFLMFLPLYSLAHLFAGEKKEKIWKIFWIIVCALVLVCIIGWGVIATHSGIYPAHPANLGYTDEPGFSVSYVLHHPGRTIVVLLATLVQSGENHFISNLIGCNLEDLTLELPGSFKFIFLMIILLSAVASPDSEIELRKRTRVTLFCIAAVTTLCIAVGMLVSWTPLTSPQVQGIQGRYYIPIIFMLLILLNNRSVRISDQLHHSVVPAVIIMDLLVPAYIFATAG